MRQPCTIIFLALALYGVAMAAATGHARPADQYSGYAILPAYKHYDPQRLREVQIALRRQGYYSGVADGFMGYRTDLAISRFQFDHEHPVRPVVDRWLLVNLGILRPVVD
jgi:Putative peptidoglycan binding domain